VATSYSDTTDTCHFGAQYSNQKSTGQERVQKPATKKNRTSKKQQQQRQSQIAELHHVPRSKHQAVVVITFFHF
jgi:hypothetical protein